MDLGYGSQLLFLWSVDLFLAKNFCRPDPKFLTNYIRDIKILECFKKRVCHRLPGSLFQLTLRDDAKFSNSLLLQLLHRMDGTARKCHRVRLLLWLHLGPSCPVAREDRCDERKEANDMPTSIEAEVAQEALLSPARYRTGNHCPEY